MNKNVNHSIQCSVTSCAYHADAQDYCTLNEIKVGCCKAKPTCCDNTECASFELDRTKGCGR